MRLVLIGPPGSGKGTQAQKVAQHYGLGLLSTGLVLRKAIQAQTTLGKQIEDLISQGKLVPDIIVAQLVENHIKLSNRFLLDGYPRNLEQATILDKILDEQDSYIDAVIKVDLSDDLVHERLMMRKVCVECGLTARSDEESCLSCSKVLETRKDDVDNHIIDSRLAIYHTHDKALSLYYQKQGIMHLIDGSNSIDKVFADIKVVLDHLNLGVE